MFRTLINGQHSAWFDINERSVKEGCAYLYTITSEEILKNKGWAILVLIDKSNRKAIVRTLLSTNISALADQLMRRSSVFKGVSPENLTYYNYFYHPVSKIKFIGAKIKKEFVTSENEIPSYIKDDARLMNSGKVRFTKYKEVAKSERLKDAMVVLIEKDNPCLLAYYYYLEMIVGAYKKGWQSMLEFSEYSCVTSNCP